MALSSQKRLEQCDLLLFLYDMADPHSFSYIANLIEEYKLYNFPMMIIGTKADLDPAVQKYTSPPEQWCNNLGIGEPKRWSNKEYTDLDIYGQIMRNVLSPYVSFFSATITVVELLILTERTIVQELFRACPSPERDRPYA